VDIEEIIKLCFLTRFLIFVVKIKQKQICLLKWLNLTVKNALMKKKVLLDYLQSSLPYKDVISVETNIWSIYHFNDTIIKNIHAEDATIF